MINAVLVFNNNGQPRLTKFYTQLVSHCNLLRGVTCSSIFLSASQTPCLPHAPPLSASTITPSIFPPQSTLKHQPNIPRTPPSNNASSPKSSPSSPPGPPQPATSSLCPPSSRPPRLAPSRPPNNKTTSPLSSPTATTQRSTSSSSPPPPSRPWPC